MGRIVMGCLVMGPFLIGMFSDGTFSDGMFSEGMFFSLSDLVSFIIIVCLTYCKAREGPLFTLRSVHIHGRNLSRATLGIQVIPFLRFNGKQWE